MHAREQTQIMSILKNERPAILFYELPSEAVHDLIKYYARLSWVYPSTSIAQRSWWDCQFANELLQQINCSFWNQNKEEE